MWKSNSENVRVGVLWSELNTVNHPGAFEMWGRKTERKNPAYHKLNELSITKELYIISSFHYILLYTAFIQNYPKSGIEKWKRFELWNNVAH